MNSVNRQLYMNLLMVYFMKNFQLNKKVYCKNCYFDIVNLKVRICDETSMVSYRLKKKYKLFFKFFNKIIVNNNEKTVKFFTDDEIFIKNFL